MTTMTTRGRHAAPGPVRTTGGWSPARHRARVRTTVPAMTRALALGAIVGALTMTPAIADAGWTPARVADLTQLPACADGEATGDTGARCVWDASHMGNGKGRSFRINRAGELKFLSHDRAHALTLGDTRDGARA
jgi:hypothetical protein